MKVAIKEPHFKICNDGMTAVRVDNPAEVCVDNTSEDKNGQPDRSFPNNLEEMERIRCEGNQLFREHNWSEAMRMYSRCINECAGITDHRKDFNRVIMLAYTNRSEAGLRLQAYETALSDADQALKFDSNHVKSLVRKGKAAHGLRLYEKACQCFKTALRQSPSDQVISNNLEASTVAFEQSQTGIFDFFNYLSADDIPPCTDFVGPVEIRRLCYGSGRRGLFVTRDVKAGKVILVGNPLAISRINFLTTSETTNLQLKRTFLSATLESDKFQDLTITVANRIMTSKRYMSQLYSLTVRGKQEMEIPSMDLFWPGSEWTPPGADKLQVDIALISEIVSLNSMDYCREFNRKMAMAKEEHACKDHSIWSGIWVLQSFANHSCTPNCLRSRVGSALFYHANRDLKKDEELTISYCEGEDLFETLEARQVAARMMFGKCECERHLGKNPLSATC